LVRRREFELHVGRCDFGGVPDDDGEVLDAEDLDVREGGADLAGEAGSVGGHVAVGKISWDLDSL
jgi:hypothetical protein